MTSPCEIWSVGWALRSRFQITLRSVVYSGPANNGVVRQYRPGHSAGWTRGHIGHSSNWECPPITTSKNKPCPYPMPHRAAWRRRVRPQARFHAHVDITAVTATEVAEHGSGPGTACLGTCVSDSGLPPRGKVTARYHEVFGELGDVRHANLATATQHDGSAGHCVLFDGMVREG